MPELPVPAAATAVAGALWWTVGCSVLAPGLGTLAVAAGLLVTGALCARARRRNAPRLPAPARAELVRLGLLGALLSAGAASALSWLGWGELAVPATCLVTGGCLVAAAGVLGRRGTRSVASGMMLLGVAGALLALRSAGPLASTGLTGWVAGALLWGSVAVELGLPAGPWSRSRVGR